MSSARLALVALLSVPAAAQIVFAPPQPHALSHPVLAPLAGDVDFDGDADVVVQGALPGPFQTANMSVLLASGGGALGAPTVSILSVSPVGEGQIVDIADFDGPVLSLPDGFPDVLLGGVGFATGVGIGWMAGNGHGAFGGLSGFTGFNLTATGIVDVAAVDIDGDGDLDLVGLDGGASIFLPAHIITGTNVGNGAFSFTTSAAAPSSASFLAVSDVDGDGRPDAVCNGNFGGTISIFRGNAAGGFLAPVVVPLGGGPREIACVDLDADGAADVLVANDALDAVQVLMGNGSGGLHAPVAYPAGHLPFRIATGDLDGDGAVDALVSAANGEVVVLRGGGDGTLAKVATISSPKGALGLALADMDGDGDLDATVARAGTTGAVDVLLNATYPDGGPFADQGHALAGSKGYPIQIAEGTLVAGQPFAFHLLNAAPGKLAAHVVGLSPLFAPYKGGTMVPSPDLLNLLVTDGAGELHLAGPWPSGASGLTLWLQFWITDPAGVKGRAASNAVSATIP